MELVIQKKIKEGIYFHKQGNFKKAEKLYRSILKINPNHPDANHNLGVLSSSIDKTIKSLDFFKIALQSSPKIELFWISYINNLIQFNQLDEARKIIEKGKMLGMSVEKANLNLLAVEFHKMDQLQDAFLIYKILTDMKSESPEIYNNFGIILQKLDRLNEAELSFKKAISLDAKFVKAYFNIANLYKVTGNLEKAEEIYKYVIILDPKFHQAFNNLGSLLKDLGKLEAAKVVLKQALILKKDNPEACLNLGITSYGLGEFDIAEANLRQAIYLKQDFVQAHNNLGLTLRKKGRLEDAELSLRQAIKLDLNFVSAKNNLGIVLKDLRKLKEAEILFKELILLNSNLPEAHNNLGLVLFELDKFGEAKKSYCDAININSNYVSAYNNLGITLRKLRNFKDSELNIRKAIELEPNFAEAHNNLGNVLKDLGRLNDAATSYEQAMILKSDYFSAALNMASVFDYLNQKEQAKNILEKLKQIMVDNIGFRAGVYLALFSFMNSNFVKSKNYLLDATKILKKPSSKLRNEQIYYEYLSKILQWHNEKNLNEFDDINNKTLNVLGDSHSLVSHSLTVNHLGFDFTCKSELIMGCKQWHLGNSSDNQYKRKFEIIFNELPKSSYVLLTIGEIDCRIDDGIIKHKNKNSSNNIKEIINITVVNYIDYITKINSHYNHKIIIQGVPCPNLDLKFNLKEDINQLINVIRLFNSVLKRKSKEQNFDFLDLHKLTDRGDGMSNQIWHLDDIHLSPKGMQKAWMKYI